MTKRTRVALAMSAALLAIGAALAHFGMTIGLIIKIPVMVSRIVVALMLPGAADGSWWQSTLAYLLAWAMYTIVFGFVLKRIGAFKTRAEVEQQIAEQAAAKKTGLFVKLAGYAATAALVFVIAKMQGKQEEEFTEKSRVAAVERCNRDSACLKNVDEHFSACFEENHESHKSGKFNRKHSLDQAGFDNCLASFQSPAEPQQYADEAGDAPAETNVEPAEANVVDESMATAVATTAGTAPQATH